MRLPKSVVIAGLDFRVKYNRSVDGADWSSRTGLIRINPKRGEPVFALFLHEVIEALMTRRGYRYEKNENCNCEDLYIFSHPQYVELIRDLAVILRPMLKD